MLNKKKTLLLLVVIALIVAYFAFDLGRYFNLQTIKDQQASVNVIVAAYPVRSVLVYFAGYVLITALSLPGAAVLTLLGGAIFGLLWGTVIVSFASSLGALLAFLLSRFLFHDMIQSRFSDKLCALNEGIKKEGAFYLFALRLVPLFPFFVINIVMGLTAIRPLVFYVVSQIGMLPGTLVYVNAGKQLATIEQLGDIVSLPLLFSFVLLGILPLLGKKIVALCQWIKAR